MKQPTRKVLEIAIRLLHLAGSNPDGASAKSSIEQTLRPRIRGHFSIEHYQVLKADYAVTLAGVQTHDIYEITARYAIAFSGGRIDEDALVRIGCTKRSRYRGLLLYHCMTTIEFRKTANGWKAITLRAPCAFISEHDRPEHNIEGGKTMTATTYITALKKGLKEAINVIEALDSMTPASEEFRRDVLQPLRDVLKLKIQPCPVCDRARKIVSQCPRHE